MKMILTILICSIIITNSGIAELTNQDIDKIQEIVRKIVEESEKRTKAEINGLKWGIGLLAMFIVGQIALIIYALSQTSREVEKVREYRDNVKEVINVARESTSIVKEYNENLKDLREKVDTSMQSLLDLQQDFKQFREYVESQT